MGKSPLIAHSLAEARLYLRVFPCPSCRGGPCAESETRPTDGHESPAMISIAASCTACHTVTTLTFQLPAETSPGAAESARVINPTSHASHLIDVAQWITLSRVLVESASNESDKVEARRLKLEASQCIEEALKFYDDVGNDLPPPEAFFHDASRRRVKDNPEEFSRQRLVNWRSKLPTPATAQRQAARADAEPRVKKRWWRRRG